jgi:adenine phosphoribosyltransferase
MSELLKHTDNILQIKSFAPETIRIKTERVRESFIGKQIFMIHNTDGEPYPYVPLTLTDSCPPTEASLIEDMADLLIFQGNFSSIDLLVSEADRGGGPLIQAVGRKTGIPYALANWDPVEIPGAISIPAKVGFSGQGYFCLFGLEKGLNTVIIDDMLSSGGTAVALIEAIRKSGAYIDETLFVGEKVNLGGRMKIEERNVKVQSLVKFIADIKNGVTTDADR